MHIIALTSSQMPSELIIRMLWICARTFVLIDALATQGVVFRTTASVHPHGPSLAGLDSDRDVSRGSSGPLSQ